MAVAVHGIERPIRRVVPLKVVPTPTGPPEVCSASGIAVCHVHQRDASVVRANTSPTGHLIAMLSSTLAI
ncbi:hypothetical protein ASZ90_015465 [hydrocarbon metagenome]|uniref:Uncharacterized protein n=1 Tax=hydrocarbon metagenome TaxID=938273 RepID=A0A0W8F1V7_9ZZZZ